MKLAQCGLRGEIIALNMKTVFNKKEKQLVKTLGLQLWKLNQPTQGGGRPLGTTKIHFYIQITLV